MPSEFAAWRTIGFSWTIIVSVSLCRFDSEIGADLSATADST